MGQVVSSPFLTYLTAGLWLLSVVDESAATSCDQIDRASQSSVAWFAHALSQFQEAVGHWGGPDRSPCEARDDRGQIVSAINAVFEFGQIARDVLAVDGTIGSGNGRLDIAQRCIDPFEGRRASRLGSGSGFDDLVCAPSVS